MRHFPFAWLSLCAFLVTAAPAQAEQPAPSAPPSLAAIDAAALSGEPERIRKAIDAYQHHDIEDPEVAWRLVRAYFNYYDELTERDRRDDQQWAADQGYALAKRLVEKHPKHPQLVYYYATIGLCYLDFHRMKAIFLVNDLLDTFHKAAELDPKIDDGGADRSLGLLYYQLPGWPLGKGDKDKALKHLARAVELEPRRAANRLTLAKVLADYERYDEGWTHIEFVRAGDFKVSSPHWKKIYLRRVEEVAEEFPQYTKVK